MFASFSKWVNFEIVFTYGYYCLVHILYFAELSRDKLLLSICDFALLFFVAKNNNFSLKGMSKYLLTTDMAFMTAQEIILPKSSITIQ